MWKTESLLIAIVARFVQIVFNCEVCRSFVALVLLCAVVVPAFGQTSVLTQHNDNARTGQNTSETILNTSNVNVNQFGKRFAMPTDDQVYAQPLYVPGVTINGVVHNVVIIATESDSVYAYDADSSGAYLWKASMVDAAHGAGTGETPLNNANTINCEDMQTHIGITSTPVIDSTSQTIFVEAKSTNGTTYFHRLHALDLRTGNEKTPGPIVVDATVSGTGDGSSNGQLVFHDLALYQLNRPGLLLLNGTIYIAYASHCDDSPYHGWLFAYDEASFTLKSVYVTTPNGGLGGFWMSGAGVAADESGNIFIPSGNGDFDTTHVPAQETGDSIIKLGTTNQLLTQLDYFTPQDQANLQANDLDLGSGGVLILPDQPGSFPHILVEAGKEGRIYVVNRDQMTTNNSHYCSGCANDPEIIEETGSGAIGGIWGMPAYWNNNIYFWASQDVLRSIPITNGLPDFTNISSNSTSLGFPGAMLSISSNGTTAGTAILWAIDASQYGSPGPGPGPAVVHAYDATNISKELWNSSQAPNNHDKAGNAVKFSTPTISNGKVYVGTFSEVDVYGLLSANLPTVSSISPSSATAAGPAFALTINGTGFVSGATVNFGSNPAITPSSVTSTQIVATVPATDTATAATVNVSVTNPAGGGTSNAQTFTINNPAPTATSLSPTSATAGGAPFTLTVNGTGFVSTSVVKFNGATKTTTFISATQLTAAITAADIATAGTASVIVTNPAPGGGTSGSLSFTITAVSAPTLTSIAPTSSTAGGAAFTFTITGTGFISGATVNFGSNPAITPSSVTSTQIVATVPATDTATAATVNVSVTNPAGGGTSNAQTFTINNPAPTATSLSPTSATAGGAPFTLTVNGTGFVSTSVVKFNGATKTTTFISATQLTAAITAADIATAGTASVIVTNPAPGGGTSGSLSFTITAVSAPTLTSIAPTSSTAGGAAFTFTITGTGFISGATVNFGSNPAITPSSVTSTQIVATVPATDTATAATVNVSVTNPAGGGTSNAQTFTINNPAPTATSLSPTSATAGGAPFTLTVNGTGFVSTSVVKFNGATKTTTFISATQLTAAITAADIATAGTASVTVTNPAPGGGTSGSLSFTITAVSAPTLTSIAPTSSTAGGAAFTFTITGTGFISGATVNFGSNPAITPSSVTSTQIVATVPATDIATAATVNVSVTNPAGGGTSNAQTFTINNPAPTATSLSPTSATAGGAPFTLTVNGTGFVSTSVVKFNGATKTTTFISATQLTAAITAADIATAGTASVTVTNPAPGGGTSGSLSFTITAVSAPTLTSIAPTSSTAGGAAFTFTITGTGFISGATVNFGSNPAITPSSVTSTQIVATVPATDTATAATVNVSVTNPAGGGTSNAQTFTINNPAPTATSLSPTSATAGGAPFTLTVNGTGFVSTSVVKFNGATKTTTFISATQLTAAITAADIATAGTASVTVTNPAPGGGTSGSLSFTITAASAPTLTSVAPTSSTAGGAAFTFTITGTGFISGATVNFGSNPAITPSSVTSTQIVATVPATDTATAATVNVSVTNPAGGGTSNAQTFTINNPAPTATSLSPTSATAGGAPFTLTVNGTGFVSTSVVKFNEATKTTTFISATQLTAAITAADIATAGTASVTVTNPAPGGGTSGSLSFTITAVSAPTLTSIAPTSATAGGAAFTLTLTGAGFVSGATVNFGSNPAITPSSVTSTQIVATVPATDIATAATVNVSVTNPAPGGVSASVLFTIDNPSVAITSISPTSAIAGGAAFTLTLNGSGFVSGSVVKFNGIPKVTTFTSNTQLSVAIAAADIATAGMVDVIVTNPAPGGTSSSASFTINNSAPKVSLLSPSTAVAGSAAFTLTVNGAGFVSGADVQFNGSSRTTTFISTTQITAAILESDIATAGAANVTVTNPAPAIGPSAPQVFTISSPDNPVPTIAGLGATHAAGGAAFTLAVNGTNFEAKSVVNFNGKPEATTFVSATRLSAAIPASDVAVAGNMNVTVANPAPGGGTSAASVFTVDGYTISGLSGTSLSPSQPTMIQITVTPTANGFPNSILFNVSGLPAGATASFKPAMLTPNGNATSTTLTITDGTSAVSPRGASIDAPGSRLLPSLLAIWIAALLGWFYWRLQVRLIPHTKRYAVLALFALILLTGGILSGCALSVNSSPSTSSSQLTVTATSGTLTQTLGITLKVTR